MSQANPRGRDARLPGLRDPGVQDASSAPDSVVINGTGVCALTMAVRCARDGRLRDHVTIVGERVQESRRLVGGVTFRARTLDYIAAASGQTTQQLLQRFYGPEWHQAETHQQVAALCSGDAGRGYAVTRSATFMDAKVARPGRSPHQPLAYGLRNSRLVTTLHALADEAGCETAAAAPSREQLTELASGEQPFLVNGAPRPLVDTPVDRPPAKPRQFVAAAQMALRNVARDQRGVIGPNTSFISWIKRGGGIDMGVFYPFQDELSPTADLYGIYYRVIGADDASSRREEIQDDLSSTVVAIADMLGFEPVDPDETLGTAVVPVSPWNGVSSCQDGVLDLSRLAGAGSPIITGDGMTRSTLAGWVAAECLRGGHDVKSVEADLQRALARYRQLNRELHWALSSLASPAATLMRWSPGLVLYRQTRSYHRDMWARAA